MKHMLWGAPFETLRFVRHQNSCIRNTLACFNDNPVYHFGLGWEGEEPPLLALSRPYPSKFAPTLPVYPAKFGSNYCRWVVPASSISWWVVPTIEGRVLLTDGSFRSRRRGVVPTSIIISRWVITACATGDESPCPWQIDRGVVPVRLRCRWVVPTSQPRGWGVIPAAQLSRWVVPTPLGMPTSWTGIYCYNHS